MTSYQLFLTLEDLYNQFAEAQEESEEVRLRDEIINMINRYANQSIILEETINQNK